MGLTKRQRKAWEGYGITGIEEVPPEFGTVESLVQRVKAVDITKGGGYEELPEEIIVRAAEKAGLSREDIPPIVVEEADLASVSLREGETTIVIPRRLSRRRTPGTLVHEFTHYKLGHQPDVEETYGEHFIKELQADRAGGRVSTSDLIDRIFSAVDHMELSWRDAIDIILHAAREVGVSKVVIRRAQRWVRNYIDRYGLDLDEGRTW